MNGIRIQLQLFVVMGVLNVRITLSEIDIEYQVKKLRTGLIIGTLRCSVIMFLVILKHFLNVRYAVTNGKHIRHQFFLVKDVQNVQLKKYTICREKDRKTLNLKYFLKQMGIYFRLENIRAIMIKLFLNV